MGIDLIQGITLHEDFFWFIKTNNVVVENIFNNPNEFF